MTDEPRRKDKEGAVDPSKTRLFYSPDSPALAQSRATKQPPPLPARSRAPAASLGSPSGAHLDWQSKTRVLPIELLVPGALAKLRQPSTLQEHTQKLHRPAPPRRTGLLSKQRVLSWAACLVLWVSVAAASRMPSSSGQLARAPGVEPAPSVPSAERTQPMLTRLPREASPPEAAHAAAPRLSAAQAAGRSAAAPVLPKVAPRAALEALAAGDTLAAAHLYAALAKQNPDHAAYARAARILQLRLQAPASSARGAP